MILHLDNMENVGPKSEDARAEWRKRKKRPATINENHAEIAEFTLFHLTQDILKKI